jgi:hypothetical protein
MVYSSNNFATNYEVLMDKLPKKSPQQLEKEYNSTTSRIKAKLMGALFLFVVVAWAYWEEGLTNFIMVVFLPVSAGIAILVGLGLVSESALLGLSSDAINQAVGDRLRSYRPNIVVEAEAAQQAAAT